MVAALRFARVVATRARPTRAAFAAWPYSQWRRSVSLVPWHGWSVIALISAPSNLGLRPPQPGAVPGTAKAPEALREAGLFDRFLDRGAVDAGVVLTRGYVDDDRTRRPGRVRNQASIVEHTHRLAERIDGALVSGRAPLVIGGDCSLLLSAGLARRATGQLGLVHVDGHTDFRHPGNSGSCASLAGEDLAAAVGLHWPSLSDINGRGPYFDGQRTVQIGCRDDDEHLDEARSLLGLVVTAGEVLHRGPVEVAAAARVVAGRQYWLLLDVDVLDPKFMPAVDSPDPGGLDPEHLVSLLQGLAPQAVGALVTVFDPDLDSTGVHATLLTDIVVAGLAGLGSARDIPPAVPVP